MQEFETLKKLVTDAEADISKAEGGNRAAGTRVRKAMQDIKLAAQAIRQRVLDSRATEEGGTPPATPPQA
jgi:hypothetical protein